jgi:hypothetical protein
VRCYCRRMYAVDSPDRWFGDSFQLLQVEPWPIRRRHRRHSTTPSTPEPDRDREIDGAVPLFRKPFPVAASPFQRNRSGPDSTVPFL